jgi:spermidine/putrescine transport system permease protein
MGSGVSNRLARLAILTPLWVVAVGGMLFIYVPILVVMLYSFSDDQIMSFPLKDVSLRWYIELASDRQLLQAVGNSAIVALSSITIGLIVGIPGAFALDRFDFFGKRLLETLLLLPFVLPGVLFGIALLVFYLAAGVKLSLLTVIVGHSTLLIVVVIVVIRNGLRRWDRSLEAAAMDLGANEIETFFLVVLPNIKTSIIGAILLGITLSLDEIVRTFFWTGTDNTLPTFVWSMLRLGITPEINAIASIIFVISAIAISIVVSRQQIRSAGRGK